MAIKSDIITLLLFQLRSIPNVTVFNYFKYLDQINSFPTICTHVIRDDVEHIESNYIDHYSLVSIRAYLQAENCISACDDLIQEIETIVNGITNVLFDSMKIESVNSDEGLFEPYGIVDINLSINNKYSITVVQQDDTTLYLITQDGEFLVTQDNIYLRIN